MFGRRKYYTDRGVTKKGKQDGRPWKWRAGWPPWEPKDPIPPVDQKDLTEFEERLISDAERNLSSIAHKWSEKDDKLHHRCKNAADRYKNAKGSKNKEVPEQNEAIKKYQKAKKAFDSQQIPHISSVLALFLIEGDSL